MSTPQEKIVFADLNEFIKDIVSKCIAFKQTRRLNWLLSDVSTHNFTQFYGSEYRPIFISPKSLAPNTIKPHELSTKTKADIKKNKQFYRESLSISTNAPLDPDQYPISTDYYVPVKQECRAKCQKEILEAYHDPSFEKELHIFVHKEQNKVILYKILSSIHKANDRAEQQAIIGNTIKYIEFEVSSISSRQQNPPCTTQWSQAKTIIEPKPEPAPEPEQEPEDHSYHASELGGINDIMYGKKATQSRGLLATGWSIFGSP